MRKVLVVIMTSLLGIVGISDSTAADTISISDSSAYTANVTGVGSVWKGNIPTSIVFPLGNYSQKIEFPIQGLLPISVLSDRSTGTSVEFELWADSGKKIASDTVSSYDWNPVGPNTLVSMYLSETDALGTHVLIVRTIYKTKTNGLLSSYLSKEDKFPFSVKAKKKSQAITVGALKDRNFSEGSFTIYSFDAKSSEYSLDLTISTTTPSTCVAIGKIINLMGAGICTLSFSQAGNDTIAPAETVFSSFNVKGSRPVAVGDLSATIQGTSLVYSFSRPLSSTPIVKYEVTIQRLLRSGLPVAQYLSYGPYSILKTVYSEQFTVTADEVKSYLMGESSSDISNTSVMIRVIAHNDMGASDLSGGNYLETSRFGWKSNPSTKKIVITCTKGSVKKKVSGNNPKCPAGYKKN